MVRFKNGDVIFFNWHNPYFKIIRFYNKLEYGTWGFGHVGLVTDVDGESILIHEAIGKGYIRSWYNKKFLEDKIKQGSCAIKRYPKRLFDVKFHADKNLGKGYGWFDIIGIGLCFLFNWKGMKTTGASKLICSEAVARVLYDASNKELNFEKEFNKTYDLITPMDIFLSKQLKNA